MARRTVPTAAVQAPAPQTAAPRSRSARNATPARRMGRRPVPEGETRRDKFMRIGQRRMEAVIRQIQLLGNLCSPAYDCNSEDITLMRDTIMHELDMALARFTPRKRQEGGKPSFRFDTNTHH